MIADSLTILGCGTSTGVPRIHCDCAVCTSKDPRNSRLRASVWFQIAGKSILIDTATDLRQQAMRERIPRVDAVLYTHPHADHIHGIDELRSFNFIQKEVIPLYGNDWLCDELSQKFTYIFNPSPYSQEGGGIPMLELHRIRGDAESFEAADVRFTPIALKHGSKECLAYRHGHTAYVTDCNEIPPSSLDRLRGLDTLVLDCVQLAPHKTHLSLDRALATIETLRPGRTYLTHLGHDFDYEDWNRKLPKGVELAYDGLKIPL